MAPALYTHVDPKSELAQDEVHSARCSPPCSFDDEAEAIRLANSTQFGLVAGVWSKDGSRALRVARKVRVGQMFVNRLPSAGRRASNCRSAG